MTITLNLVPEVEQEIQEAAARQGKTVEALTQEALMAAMLTELRNRPVPQSLDALKPRRLPPPGKTVWDMIVGQWPGDETDEELQRALEELS